MDFEKQIQTDRESLIQDIMKLVSIDSVETAPDAGMPFGAGAAKALDCFLETAESIGLKTENFDYYAGHADYGDQEETLGILGHVDVVPCSGSWVCDPFKPEIIDGKLYGRGVLDDKGPLLACLHAVKILKEMGVPLSKKIRFIVGANEETDWKCMDYYFNKKKIPAPQMSFTPDAVFPLIYAEKGVFQYQLVTDVSEDITLSGGNAFNAVADHASSRTGNRDPQEPALLGDTDQMPFHSRKCRCIPPADRRRFCRTRSTSFYRNQCDQRTDVSFI